MSGLIKNKMRTLVDNSLFGQLTSTFQELELTNEPSFLKSLRQEAFARFEREGFPTVKNEEWKYTNIQSLVNKAYLLNEVGMVQDLNLTQPVILGWNAPRGFWVMGHMGWLFLWLDWEGTRL